MTSPFSSFEDNSSFAVGRKNHDLVIERAIAGLDKCLQNYQDKARNSDEQLEKFGFTAKDLPEDLRTDLKEALKDDCGVYDFARASSKNMVSINADHVLDSLQENYERKQLQILVSQMTRLVDEFKHIQLSLERKLVTEKDEADKLESKRFDKEAKLMMFKGKLEASKRELENLRKLSQSCQKPKYSLEEIDSLKQAVDVLKNRIAVTNIKLKKYNDLPFNQKDALKQIMKIREELKIVDNEIRNKVSCIE